VESWTSPIREASGHSIGSLVPSFICARLQPCRPSAKEGLKLIPFGKVTVNRFTGGVPSPFGFSFWATSTWTSNPVGVLACLPVGSISTSGSKRGLSHPVC
jgi:hypothetical protein